MPDDIAHQTVTRRIVHHAVDQRMGLAEIVIVRPKRIRRTYEFAVRCQTAFSGKRCLSAAGPPLEFGT